MRGGARKGAGRPPVPLGQEQKVNYTIRVYQHEKQLVKKFLKNQRKHVEKIIKDDEK